VISERDGIFNEHTSSLFLVIYLFDVLGYGLVEIVDISKSTTIISELTSPIFDSTNAYELNLCRISNGESVSSWISNGKFN